MKRVRVKEARDALKRTHPKSRQFWGILFAIAVGVGIGHAAGYNGVQNPWAIFIGAFAGIGRSFVAMLVVVLLVGLYVWRGTLMRLPALSKRRKARRLAMDAFDSRSLDAKLRPCWQTGVDQAYRGLPNTKVFSDLTQERTRRDGFQTAIRMGAGK